MRRPTPHRHRQETPIPTRHHQFERTSNTTLPECKGLASSKPAANQCQMAIFFGQRLKSDAAILLPVPFLSRAQALPLRRKNVDAVPIARWWIGNQAAASLGEHEARLILRFSIEQGQGRLEIGALVGIERLFITQDMGGTLTVPCP